MLALPYCEVSAAISTDPEHLKVLAINGKPPISVLRMTVEEAFLLPDLRTSAGGPDRR